MSLDDDFFADATDADAAPRAARAAVSRASEARRTSPRPPSRPVTPAEPRAAVRLRERLGGARSASSAASRNMEPVRTARGEPAPEASVEQRPPRPILRSEVHHHDGSPLRRLRTWIADALTSPAELAEFAEDRRLAQLPSTSRTNLIVFVGPRGGVGKTTIARAVGGLLSSARCGTVVLMDADRDYGPAGDLAPDSRRSAKSLSDLLADFDEPPHPPQLRPYLSTLDDGLLILGAPSTRAEMRALAPEHYARALGLLRGADVVLMDCAGGIGDLQEWALRVADQAVVFATPDYVAANNVAKVLSDPDVGLPRRSTLVLNNPRPEGAGDMVAIEQHFARHHLEERVVMPYDQRLRVMLDQGTYELGCLDRTTRVPLKRLAAAVGEGLR
jgi:MinD-like ATPase involved in chromosome partitioning or flagellar assembly